MKKFEIPLMAAPTCDWPNCENAMYMGIAGCYEGKPYPSQWCEKHLEIVQKKCKKDPNWIIKFQEGKIKNLPQDKRNIKVYAW